MQAMRIAFQRLPPVSAISHEMASLQLSITLESCESVHVSAQAQTPLQRAFRLLPWLFWGNSGCSLGTPSVEG